MKCLGLNPSHAAVNSLTGPRGYRNYAHFRSIIQKNGIDQILIFLCQLPSHQFHAQICQNGSLVNPRKYVLLSLRRSVRSSARPYTYEKWNNEALKLLEKDESLGIGIRSVFSKFRLRRGARYRDHKSFTSIFRFS